MKPPPLGIFLALVLGGYAPASRPPSEVAPIHLELCDSPLVRVNKAWLERPEPPR